MGLRTLLADGLGRLVERAASAHARATARPAAAPTTTLSRLPADDGKPTVIVLRGQRAAPQLDPGYFSSLGGGNQRLTNPFAQHPYVYAAVHRIATLVASAPFQLGRWNDEGAFEPEEHHALDEVFRRPNKVLSGQQLWYLRMAYMLLAGEAFFILDRDHVAQEPRAIGVVRGGREWAPVLDKDTRLPIGWVLTRNGQKIPYETWEVVQFKLPDPSNPLRGLAPMDVAQVPVERDVLADRFEKSTLENGSMPGGYLKYPKDVEITTDQYEEIKRLWEDRHKGAGKAGRMAIIDQGGEFVFPPLTPHDLEFPAGRAESLKQICAVFGIPEWVLTGQGLGGAAATGPGMREAYAQFIDDTIAPFWNESESALEAQLFIGLNQNGLVGHFDKDSVPAMRAARRGRFTDLATLLTSRVSLKQANRVLETGLTEEPLWDEPFAPLGVAPISDLLLAPTPAPPTPAAPAPAEAEEPMAEEPEEEPEDESMPMHADTARGAAMVSGHLATLSGAARVAAERRRKVWRLWNKDVLVPSIAGYQRALKPVLAAMGTEALARFDKVTKGRALLATEGRAEPVRPALGADELEQVLFDLTDANASFITAIRPQAFRAADLSAAFTSGELGEWTQIDLLHDDVQDFLERRMALLSNAAGGIPARARIQLAKSLQKGMAAGETVQALRTRIETFADALADPARTLRIARTESGVVANTTRYLAAKPYADFHVWATADDEIVRPTHQHAEAESNRAPVRIGQPFSNGLLYPLDPNGPAAEVIACRCVALVLPREAA